MTKLTTPSPHSGVIQNLSEHYATGQYLWTYEVTWTFFERAHPSWSWLWPTLRRGNPYDFFLSDCDVVYLTYLTYSNYNLWHLRNRKKWASVIKGSGGHSILKGLLASYSSTKLCTMISMWVIGHKGPSTLSATWRYAARADAIGYDAIKMWVLLSHFISIAQRLISFFSLSF